MLTPRQAPGNGGGVYHFLAVGEEEGHLIMFPYQRDARRARATRSCMTLSVWEWKHTVFLQAFCLLSLIFIISIDNGFLMQDVCL